MVHSFCESKSTWYRQASWSPLRGVVAGSGLILQHRMNKDVALFVQSDLSIRDNRAAEDSAVFQIVYRFIDLLERVPPRDQLI